MTQAQRPDWTALTMLLMVASCGGDSSSAIGDAEVHAGEDGGVPSVEDGSVTSSGSQVSMTDAADTSQDGVGAQEAFFRFDTFVLNAPSLVLRVLTLETPVTSDVQSMLDMSLAEDTEPADGNVDLSMLLRFSGGADPAKEKGKVTLGGALCPYPLDAARPCRADPSAPLFEPQMNYSNASKCELKGTSQTLSAACFQSSMARTAVSLPLFGPVVLDDAQIIGSWAGAGKDGIVDGLIRGFVSEQTAMTTTIQGAVPSHLALVGIQTGTPLTSFLSQATRENGTNGAGWSFLAHFTARPVQFRSRE